MGHGAQGPPLTVVEANRLKPGQITGWGQVKEGSGESQLWNGSLGEDMRPGELRTL